MAFDDRSDITKAELPSREKAFMALLRARFIPCSQSGLGRRVEPGELCLLGHHLPRDSIKARKRKFLGLVIRNDDTVVHIGNKLRGFCLPRDTERRNEKLPDESI